MSKNFRESRSNLTLSLNIYIDNSWTKLDIHKSKLGDWKQNVLKLVDDSMSELSRQPKQSASSILKEHHPNNNLKDLQFKYVLTPIEKATNNVTFICQTFYAPVLVKDLATQNNNASNTYSSVFESNKSIVKSHHAMLEKKINLKLSSEDKRLLHKYCLLNVRKHPIGSRFLITA